MLHPLPPPEQLLWAGGTMQARAGASPGTPALGMALLPREGGHCKEAAAAARGTGGDRDSPQESLAGREQWRWRHQLSSCSLAQEGSTQIQMSGSDPPSHRSPELRGNSPTPPLSWASSRPGTAGRRHLHPRGPERSRVGGRGPRGSRAASSTGGHHPNPSQRGLPGAGWHTWSPHGGGGSPGAAGTAGPGGHSTLHALRELRAPSHGKASGLHPSCGRGLGHPVPGHPLPAPPLPPPTTASP